MNEGAEGRLDQSSCARDVAAFIAWSKATFAREPLSRPLLARILARLEQLAAKEYWSGSDFPDPPPGEEGPLYLISEDRDRSFALYLNILTPGMNVSPHNHTTWACVAAHAGCEMNMLYQRLDDGKAAGRAEIHHMATFRIEPGLGIALMPDDIHAIANRSGQITRHLHFYGRALELLDQRLMFDLAAGTCGPMPLQVATPQD